MWHFLRPWYYPYLVQRPNVWREPAVYAKDGGVDDLIPSACGEPCIGATHGSEVEVVEHCAACLPHGGVAVL